MLSEQFDAALQFASSLHRSQVRKGTSIPYVSHVMAVAVIVLEDGGSEVEAIAALLHDSVEDCGNTFPGGRSGLRAYIAERFGSRVLEIVDACTDDEGAEKGKAPTIEAERAEWRARKERYIAHIAAMDPAALRVSCADKLHNLRSTLADYERQGEALWTRFRTQSGDDQLWHFASLAEAFGTTSLTNLPNLLARDVATLRARVAANR